MHKKELELFSFLKDARTDTTPHYQKSLFSHLSNTYATLKSWECEPHVCYAGLFHSIYGTQIFRKQTIPYEERRRIRDLIGESAERLAYLFSVSARPQGFIDALRTFQVSDPVHDATIRVTPSELSDLLLIECANLKDQENLERFCMQVLENIGIYHSPVSEAHLQKLKAILSEVRSIE